MFLFSSWNVNSVNARLEHLLSMLNTYKPDIVCLQELKCLNEKFPKEQIEDLGYNLAIHGQKTYNGVAILSKFPIEEIITEFPNQPHLHESRYLETVIAINKEIYRISSIYVPNGQEINSEKYKFKMIFLQNLLIHAKNLLKLDEKLILAGDYNIAPFDIDVYDPNALQNSICFSQDEKELMRQFFNIGLHDAYRLKHPDKKEFSWWDYRQGAFQKNQGMRIDHILLSSLAADDLTNIKINSDIRSKDKPSDHGPVCANFR